MNQIIDKDNFTETDTGEREEWMILADLKFNEKGKTEQPCVNQTDFNIAEDRSFYTTEQIGDMPHWIDQQKMPFYSKQMQHQCQLKLIK